MPLVGQRSTLGAPRSAGMLGVSRVFGATSSDEGLPPPPAGYRYLFTQDGKVVRWQNGQPRLVRI